MSDRANPFKLGLFTLTAIFLLLGFLAALGAGMFRPKGVIAETYTPDSVQGLDVGAPVRFRGVKVGEVTFIGFVSQKYDVRFKGGHDLAGYVMIQMNIDTRKGLNRSEAETTLDRALKQGLHARLASSSLMGPAYLELLFITGPGAPPALQLSWTPDGIVIPASPSLMSQITTSVEMLASQLSRIDFKKTVELLDNLLHHADEAISGTGFGDLQKSVSEVLDNAKAATARMKVVLDNPAIERILANMDQITDSLNSGSANQKDLAAFIKELPAIANNLRDASGRIDQILADPKTARILDNLDKTLASTPGAAEDVRQFVRRLNALVADSQSNIERSLGLLRSVLENVDVITADAKDNPSRIFFGDPPPRTRPGHVEQPGGRK